MWYVYLPMIQTTEPILYAMWKSEWNRRYEYIYKCTKLSNALMPELKTVDTHVLYETSAYNSVTCKIILISYPFK